MEQSGLGSDAAKAGQEIVGYLNFSSGAADPRFLKNVNRLFEALDASPDRIEPTWKALHRCLASTLHDLHGSGDAFREVEQAEAVLGLVFEKTLPGYRQFHHDLLFHQSEESLFQPLFIGRACEAVLQQGGPWDQTDRIVGWRDRAVERLFGPPPGRGAPHAAEDPAVRPRMGAADPALHQRRGRGRGPLSRSRVAGPGNPRGHRLLAAIRFDVRPGAAGRTGRRSAGLRFRPSGEQAAELSLRPMGPGQAGQRRPLPPLYRAASFIGRHAGTRRAPRQPGLRRDDLRGGGRAGGHDPDGLADQRQPARRPRFEL